nr:MAG TPA: hypothetical protein [Bacteriophage sp.]
MHISYLRDIIITVVKLNIFYHGKHLKTRRKTYEYRSKYTQIAY